MECEFIPISSEDSEDDAGLDDEYLDVHVDGSEEEDFGDELEEGEIEESSDEDELQPEDIADIPKEIRKMITMTQFWDREKKTLPFIKSKGISLKVIVHDVVVMGKKPELAQYQKEDVQWMLEKEEDENYLGGVFANESGTGKTGERMRFRS